MSGLAGGQRGSAYARSAAFAAAYLLAVWLGRLTVLAGTSLNLAWPAAGVAVVWFAAQRAAGTGWLDSAVLVAVTVVVDAATGTPPLLAACFAAANTAQVWTFVLVFGWWCPQLWGGGGSAALTELRQLSRLIAAAVLSALVGTVIGPTAAWLQAADWSWPATVVWLCRNVASEIVIGAVGLRLGRSLSAWRIRGRTGVRTATRLMLQPVARPAELILAVSASLVGYLLFFRILQGLPLAFPLLTLTVWVALRFDTTVTALHNLAAGVVAVLFTLAGDGPFAAVLDPRLRALVVQGYLAMVAIVGLTLTLGREEREWLLRQVRRQAAESADHADRVQVLARASRALFTTDDARAAICAAACEISTAHAAYLLEPDGQDGVASTAHFGEGTRPLRISAAEMESTVTAAVLAGAGFLFLPDAEADPRLSARAREGFRLASAAWQPVVVHGGQPAGVITLIWHEPIDALPAYVPAMLETLAAEAATAIEREDLLARLALAAERDPLTGLANRRRWDEVADVEIARARRTGAPLTFLLADLDHFKRYNDTQGHLNGDILLRDFADAAAGCLREVDTIARWGGEEFVLALPGCTGLEAVVVADRIRAAVPRGQTCTIGIAQWHPDLTAAQALARADAALYQGKRLGRNASVIASPELSNTL